jgi:hypothetical protein
MDAWLHSPISDYRPLSPVQDRRVELWLQTSYVETKTQPAIWLRIPAIVTTDSGRS